MSDINKMDFKQLRNEVQLLRDELAMFKRMYEDAIYNIDIDNLSTRIVKEKDDMRAELKVTAEEISTKVSNEEFKSAITQTADKISGIVSEFVDTSKATEVSSPSSFKDTEKVYVIREYEDDGETVASETFYYYNTVSKTWDTVTESGMLNSLFEQTSNGFKLKGDVRVDGSCILTDSLKFDTSDRPLEVEYSTDGVSNWHTTFASGTDKFMRIKIGGQWSDAMKVVGSDGANGKDGSNASVTSQAVFNALTNSGATQGIFSAFCKLTDEETGTEKLFINAEYLATKIANVADVVYIGNSADTTTKELIFSNGARITTYDDGTGVPYTGLFISASTLKLGSKIDAQGAWDFSDCTSVTGLDRFISGGSGGTATAVFG